MSWVGSAHVIDGSSNELAAFMLELSYDRERCKRLGAEMKSRSDQFTAETHVQILSGYMETMMEQWDKGEL